MKRLFVAALLAASCCAAEPFAITDEFVAYIQQGANPLAFGLGKDGRFKPYSTSVGRRIGWRQPVADKQWFAKGLAKADAEKLLHADLDRALVEARKLVAEQKFDALPRAAQEMLVDFVHSEGATNVSPAFTAAVLAGDWPKLIKQHLYVRWLGPSPDNFRNKAFADRWIYSEKLIPLPAAK
ncbi:MAG: hypothetical protein NTY53_15310 [Kiritimatiellaeota bacterium]|nr:hypothetical protein [Kiritimatiellota bacterium]